MTLPHTTTNGALWYPRVQGESDTLRVELYDVRAADDLIIGYDFDRDGWVISRGEEPEKELAFIRSYSEFEEEDKKQEETRKHRRHGIGETIVVAISNADSIWRKR